jgi:hypothetical protein
MDNEVWVLVPDALKSAFLAINHQSERLEDIAGPDGIFNGIQTSANEVYIFQPIKEDEHYYYFVKKGVEWKVEKQLTKPYFQTSAGEDNLNTYRPFKPNARVFYPYRVVNSEVELISLDEISKSFPFAFKYLEYYKPKLAASSRDIQPVPATPNEWHRYGRHQSLDKCGLPEKIIVGVLSAGNKYAIDFYGTLISSGGTAGYCVVALPPASPYSIYYIQALLNSKYLEWYSALIGEVFRGGYIARGTKVLKRLPIRTINFSDKADKALHDQIASVQKELIAKQDEIDQSSTNPRKLVPLTREFSQLKSKLDNLLRELFSLGSDDELIPLIKEMYEAN